MCQLYHTDSFTETPATAISSNEDLFNQEVLKYSWYSYTLKLIDRPGVAGAVLQTPLSLID